VKYRHLFDDALRLSEAELSLLAVLMLRGPQTSGELKQRVERLYHFDSPADVDIVLDGLIQRELAARLPRRPGEKGQRYAQLLGGEGEQPQQPSAEPAPADSLEARVERLEAEVRELRELLDRS
jgi:uncharacterized protein YceH (UPF0502 family)